MLRGLLFNQQNINRDHLISTGEHNIWTHIDFSKSDFSSKKSLEVSVSLMCAMCCTGSLVWAENDYNNFCCPGIVVPLTGRLLLVTALGRWEPVGSGLRTGKKEIFLLYLLVINFLDSLQIFK